MTFLILLIALSLLSGYICYIADKKDLFGLTMLSCLICGLCAVALVVGIPISRSADLSQIEKIKAVELTLESGRKTGSDIERAAILMEIAEINKRLATAKYWNSTFIGDIFIVDELANMDFIK